MPTNKLDFHLETMDGFLEARVKKGFYSISSDFKVTAYIDGNSYDDIGTYTNIYDALDSANQHFEKIEKNMKKKCVFIENLDGEGPYYCGNTHDMEDLQTGIKNLLNGELDYWLDNENEPCNIQFTARYMTDEEIEGIPVI